MDTAALDATGGARDVEAALGCHLLTSFRHKCDLVRPQAFGDRKHCVGARQLEVQGHVELFAQTFDIVVLNVPTVLAQMRGDPVRARRHTRVCGDHGVRLVGPACLTNRRDVVNVDVESQRSGGGQAGGRWHRLNLGIKVRSRTSLNDHARSERCGH